MPKITEFLPYSLAPNLLERTTDLSFELYKVSLFPKPDTGGLGGTKNASKNLQRVHYT